MSGSSSTTSTSDDMGGPDMAPHTPQTLGTPQRSCGAPRGYVSVALPDDVQLARRKRSHVAAAMSPDAGMVTIHAQRIRPATPQRTADSRCSAPTPMIEPLIVCVVLTGMPATAVPMSVIAP